MDEKGRHAAGLTLRREVPSDGRVDRSPHQLNEFTADFQDYITPTAWGTAWTREGLPRHTRSLLTIAMMAALGRDCELRLHVNAARNNGVTRDEIKEVLLQAGVYCGLPAANHAYHLAEEVFAEQDRSQA
ncbi:4-carboxymuconolactone decarboxylase [Hydrocarboniphaga effusa]|jgi:4-carboxymuconolactone decarboxylase|uniref:4-carboxymuconolactone decarboxylase n=1 Tax=Hydrocarboniphaga effusa AP103 TaxID=1172194 RepID=I7Z8J4_9GAMM|nr:3-oxoadipate enol-lactone hydrolase/4-carboxymuconolactone decarboxylase [Hydrocarboniphaga effusa AP103]